MEKRLKQQRSRLLSRVITIIAAVCVVICAAYAGICLYSEKSRIQNAMVEDMSYAISKAAASSNIYSVTDNIYSSIADLIYRSGEKRRDWNSQIEVIDSKTGETIVNTAKKEIVCFGVRLGTEYNERWYGFIDHDVLRGSLSSEQYREIEKWLQTERDDGKSYELICTKFHNNYVEFIPLELKIAAAGADNTWFLTDEIAETYSLDQNRIPEEPVFVCNEMTRNIVPKDFILGSNAGSDYISQLLADQAEAPMMIAPAGFFEDIYYVSDRLYIADHTSDGGESAEYIIRFAKKVDLIDVCKVKLAAGVGIIVSFFGVIAFILCFMLWKMIKAQAIQEQQRADLTNAIAHDIKTPIFIISGYAYSLKENIDNSERERYLDKIIEQSDAVNELVHKMLEFSKLSSTGVTLSKKEFDLYKLALDIADAFPALPDKKSIKLTRSGDNTVNADEELIKTAVGNLIDNAVRYSSPETEITIVVSDKTLTVRNESEPLTKDEISELLKPYTRKDKSRHQKGSGLGLSIVKSIADLHGAGFTMTMNGAELECQIRFNS